MLKMMMSLLPIFLIIAIAVCFKYRYFTSYFLYRTMWGLASSTKRCEA